MPNMEPRGAAADCLAGGGEMGSLMRSIDWSNTPIGPVESWSPALRTMVRILLVNRFQLFIWWGRHFVQFYNDASRPILGAKHPTSMGQPAAECWSEIWHVIGPLIETPFRGGPASWSVDISLEMNRYGYVEETHFTIAYSAVPDDDAPSGIGGVLGTVHEITEKVVGERRVGVLRDLGAHAAEAKTAEEACANAAATLSAHEMDIPFALVYLLDADGRRADLAASSGVTKGEAMCPPSIDRFGDDGPGWPLFESLEAEAARVVENLAARFPHVPQGPWSDRPTSAVVLPIPSSRPRQPAGLLVAGVSARLRLNDQYRGFLDLVAGQIGTAVANARAYEEEKKRAEALAELDRAKTAFFSNVSHEFRTPLTLILGPLEDALADRLSPLPIGHRERLEAAHRSSLRLLKLVNTLLDSARIEAGRIEASYEPTDLAALTSDIASTFRSACEKAGLRLSVDCPSLPDPVYVDRDVWEKIVLNLISNAFKFTLQGEIEVRVRSAGEAAELTVRDTGTGIPAAELPRVFERFHRVEGSRGRTHEGTGIGLALVQELVKLHGGSLRAESRPGEGSTFTVAVPSGTAHLPADRIGSTRTFSSTAIKAEAFVEEAVRWLPDDRTSQAFPDSVGNAREAFPPVSAAQRPQARATGDVAAQRPRIVWADDNADMRRYVSRLLGERYDVEAVPDGEAALAAARARPPDLILSDVMMPRLDGFGLLSALRADPTTRTIPVILLSARAGEESRVEGLQAGADDYLIKPFSARELLARVGSHIEIARVRRESERRVTSILENITEAFQVFDSDWRITYMNPEARRIFAENGFEPDAVIGKHYWDDLFPEARDDTSARHMFRAMNERVPVAFETYYAPWRMWQRCRFDPLPDGGLANYYQDITAHRQAQEQWRTFTTLVENSSDFIGVAGLDGRAWYINPAGRRLVGLEADEVEGTTILEYVIECERERFRKELLPTVVRDGWWGGETTFRHFRTGAPITMWQHMFVITEPGTSHPKALATVSRDITDRKRAEEALRQSEVRFRRYFELGLIGMAITSPTKGVVEVNDEICRILGFTREELLRMSWVEITHADDLAADLAQFNQVMAGEIDGYTMDKRWIRKGGRIIDTTISAKCVRNHDGSVEYFVSLIQDVTERKRAEQAMRDSEAKFRALAENVPSLVWTCTAEQQWDYVNPRFVRYSGCARESFLGAWRLDLIHPEDHAGTLAAWSRGTREGVPVVVELRMRRHDGAWRWFHVEVVPVRDESGRIVKWFGTNTDIDDRKRAEQALRKSESRLAADLAGMRRLQEMGTRLVHDGDSAELLQEVVDAAIAITAADMGNLQLIHRGSSTLRIAASRGFDAAFLDYFAAVHDGRSFCGTAMLSGRRVVVGDVTLSHRLAGTPTLDALRAAGVRAVQSTPLVTRSGRIIGMLSTHYRNASIPAERDLHLLDLLARQAADWIERTEAEEQLRNAKVAAEAANRAKDEFLANVSHEIRTPFGVILGMTELVLDTQLTHDQRECLRTVTSTADHLLGLIDDLLDFSKIEAGRLELNPSAFSLRGALEDVVRTLIARARTKGLALTFDIRPDTHDGLVGDARRLRQVLINLIGNAIKFTREGEVAVRVEPDGSSLSDGALVLRFTVSDTGIGIPPDVTGRIFEAFEQADSTTTRSYGGTGLGLTIAARLVGLMGGSIDVESETGEGSTFTFTARFDRQPFPVQGETDRPPSPHQRTAPASVSLRILVAEDNAFNSRHLERLLTRQGHLVHVVADGRSALDRAIDSDFDVLLLDLHMPELDGFQVVQEIRLREQSMGGHLPVIALTARARRKDRERCLVAGMDDYLAKPVGAAELLASIDRVVAIHRASSPSPADAERAGAGLDPVTLLAGCGDDAEGLRALCRDFQAFAPHRLAEVGAALRDRDATRLREAAHMLSGLLSLFSGVAGTVTAELEDLAAQRRLDEAGPLVERLETMVLGLGHQVEDLSLERLRRLAATGDRHDGTTEI